MSGKVNGDWVKGEAHFVEGTEAKRILELFNKKYGFMIKLLNFYNKLTRKKGRSHLNQGLVIGTEENYRVSQG